MNTRSAFSRVFGLGALALALLVTLAVPGLAAQTAPDTPTAEAPEVMEQNTPCPRAADAPSDAGRARARDGSGPAAVGDENGRCKRAAGAGQKGSGRAGHGGGGCGGCGRHGGGEMRGGMQGGAHGRGHGRDEMAAIWELIDRHAAIERRVQEIPGGVRTVTTSNDPEVVATLQRHAGDMAELVETGGRIRMWDPLFAELLSHTDEIVMEVESITDGVVVTETSERPEVAALIRAHADKVSEFVRRGEEAYFEETPLPTDAAPR